MRARADAVVQPVALDRAAKLACCLLLGTGFAARPASALPLPEEYGANLPLRLPPPGPANTPQAAPADCETPILAAERRYGIPTGLLLAIAIVETGRPDKRGQRQPWPWTVNAAGQGQFFQDKPAAVKWVLQTQQSGTASIDIGCLQVNLAAHPTAFRSVGDGFDPATNADYAGRFLISLYQETRDWRIAVGEYHSRTLALAEPYRDQVGRQYAQANTRERLFVQSVVAQRAMLMQQLQLAWAATLPPPNLPPPPAAEVPTRRSFP